MEKKTTLAAEALMKDPRIDAAKKLLLEAVSDHQSTLTGIRPAQPGRKHSYDELLKSFAECRGNKLWFPFLGSGIGRGALVELLDGSVKYDFISGIGVHYFGHSHPDLIASSIDAAVSDTIMQGHLQQNQDAVELSLTLCKAGNMDHCFLTSSGAMANENALKIMLQKRHPAFRILAFEHCFAGRTWSLSQITDKPSFREGIPSNIFVDYIPFFDPEHPDESTQKALNTLKSYLKRHPKEYALMLFELVQGENGFYPGAKQFFTALMEELKANHISIFMDEVQSFGRTPALFAFQYYNLEKYADVVSIGKLSQVCATLFRKDHNPRPGLLSQTFIGSTSAIHASKVILEQLMNGNYFGANGKIQRIQNHFSKNLTELAKKYPERIRGPFGIGAMVAFTPFDGSQKLVTQFVQDLFEAGVMGFIAGENPTRARFLVPAGAVTEQDIDTATSIIEKVISK
jgi:acetylornithine/N-succinyldiaminopimelate aminotransferase